jgi:uncharacterized protein (DUF433 family)
MEQKETWRMRTKTNSKPKSKGGHCEPTFVGEHLVVDPRVCHGELTFRGTRVPVETILGYLAKGYTLAYLHKSWPEVSAAAIQEAVNMASDRLIQHYRDQKS